MQRKTWYSILGVDRHASFPQKPVVNKFDFRKLFVAVYNYKQLFLSICKKGMVCNQIGGNKDFFGCPAFESKRVFSPDLSKGSPRLFRSELTVFLLQLICVEYVKKIKLFFLFFT